MTQQFSHVLFDLDGTLIDHFEAIHESYNFAQNTLGLPPASLEKVKATVGGSVPV
ncbi:MAG: HAD family hydrolase, partial [Puniceicoccales bacterium]